MELKINLLDEIGDEIVVKVLKDSYDTITSEIDEVKSTNKAVGVYSWDSVEDELEGLNKSKEHFEYVLEYFGGANWDK